jgi:hypothetical protein
MDSAMRRAESKKKIERNIAKALAEVPVDTKQERDAIRARLRRKYAELQLVKASLSTKDRRRFEELGELMDMLEACESRPPQARST